MPQKTFLICTGAQKAGTSWLWDYIDAAPGTDMGPVKEYHVLDALFLPECREFRRRVDRTGPAGAIRRAARHARYLSEGGPWSQRPKWVRYRLQASLDSYEAFFLRRLRPEGVHLTGDITPSYSGLGPKVFGEIRRRFEARGVAVKAIFLMRDPVARLISSVAMTLRHSSGPGEDMPRDLPLARALEAHYQTPAARLRSDYAATLAALRQAFPPEDVHVALFETQFSVEAHRRLAAFLGLPPRPDLLARPSYSAPRPAEAVPDDLRLRIARHYAASYRAAQEALPGVDLARHWPEFAAVAG